MAYTQPLAYRLTERTSRIGKNKDQKVIQAQATHRGLVDFEHFCQLVSRHTTFNYMEVASVLNLAADEAHLQVSSGYTVEYGKLGHLIPTLRSVQVPTGESFDASKHIKGARVMLRPKRRYFDLSNMRYERLETKKSVSSNTEASSTAGASSEEHHSDKEHKEAL